MALEPGDHFGDIAVLHQVPRTADVVADAACVTLGLDAEDLLPAVRQRVLEG